MPDKKKGYDISIDDAKHLLRLQLWGLWDLELGQQFIKEFQKKVEELGASQKTWYVLADITKFPPQIQEVQKFLSEGMLFAKTHGMEKAARIVDNTITKMQIERLSQESNLPPYAFFTDEAEAIAWLLQEE